MFEKYKKAIALGQARHDDALSGQGSIDFQLSNARLEQINVNGMGSDIADAVSAYRDAIAEFTSMFGQRETSRLEDAVDDVSNGYEEGVSSASSAIRIVIDDDTLIEGGNVASDDGSQLDHFFSDSDLSFIRGTTSLASAKRELIRLRTMAGAKVRMLRTKIIH
jgi:hypothetical protein